MKTAKFLRNLKGTWRGTAKAWELSEPLDGHSLVITSAVNDGWAHETYVFPATVESLEHDRCSDWGELTGSYRGDTDHARALREAGYEVDGDDN